jgi:hypothetical protein
VSLEDGPAQRGPVLGMACCGLSLQTDRQSVIQEYPRLGFKRESPGFSEPRPSKSLVAAPGTCTASP